MDAWAQERKVHDTKLNAVMASSFLGSNGTVPGDCFLVDGATNSFAQMELQTERLRTIEQFPNAAQPHEDTATCLHNWTSLVAPGSGVSPVRPNVAIGVCSREDLSEGRRRNGKILACCGVINASRMSPNESAAVGCGDTSDAHPVGAPMTSSVTAEPPFGENYGLFITALSDWTSEWVHTFVVQPYLQGSFRFRYVIQILTSSDLTFPMIQISGEAQ